MTDRSCPECEAPLQPDAKFCAECGAPMPTEPVGPPHSDESGAPPHDGGRIPELSTAEDDTEAGTNRPDKEPPEPDDESDADALPTLEDEDLTIGGADDDSGFDLDILASEEESGDDRPREPSERAAADATYSLASVESPSPSVQPSPQLPPRRDFDARRRNDGDADAGAAYWLDRLGKRALEIAPELSIALGGCLVGILILYAPYNKVVGGLLIGVSAAAALALLFVSPEQIERREPSDAVRAYFQALSEYVPNYRRMYAILTAKGRKCADFSTLQSFRAYWRFQLCRLAPLRFGTSSIEWHPTAIEVSESEEPGRAVVAYQLEVSPRNRAEEVLKTFAMRTPVVCGPDELWYVDEGRLQRRPGDAARGTPESTSAERSDSPTS